MTESLIGKIIDGNEVTSEEDGLWTEIDRSKKIIVVGTESNCLSARSAFGRHWVNGPTKYGSWSKDLSPIWYARDYTKFAEYREALKGELSGVISGFYLPRDASAPGSSAINWPIGLLVVANLTKNKIPFVLTGLDAENKPEFAFLLRQGIELIGPDNWSFTNQFVWRYAGDETYGWRKTYHALLKRIEEVKVK